jgi:hypothetical protein
MIDMISCASICLNTRASITIAALLLTMSSALYAQQYTLVPTPAGGGTTSNWCMVLPGHEDNLIGALNWSLYVWKIGENVPRRVLLDSLQYSSGVVPKIQLTKDGKRFLLFNNRGMIVDLPTWKPVVYLKERTNLIAGNFTSDDREVVGVASISSNQPNRMKVYGWNAETGELLYTIGPTIEKVMTVTMSPDDKSVYLGMDASGSDSGQIWKYSYPAGDLLWKVTVSWQPRNLTFNPAGDRLLCVNAYEIVEHDPASGAIARKYDFGNLGVSTTMLSGRYSPDGRRLVTTTGSQDWMIRVFDTETGELLAKAATWPNPVTTADFTPDGTRILSGGSEEATFWELRGSSSVESSAIASTSYPVIIYPNPMHDELLISIKLQEPSSVRITLMNAFGEEISTRPVEHYEAGSHSVQLSLLGVPSGVYWCTVQTGEGRSVLPVRVVQ